VSAPWLIQWLRFGESPETTELYLCAAELVAALEEEGEEGAAAVVRQMIDSVEGEE
jgi:hypothetical protein